MFLSSFRATVGMGVLSSFRANVGMGVFLVLGPMTDCRGAHVLSSSMAYLQILQQTVPEYGLFHQL